MCDLSNFDDWFEEVKRIFLLMNPEVQYSLPTDEVIGGKESWQEAFDEDMTPAEAWIEQCSYE